MFSFKPFLATLALCVTLPFASAAAPITVIQTTLDASGTIDGAIFGTPAVTVTSTGDTDDIVSFGNGFFIATMTSTVDIQGYGSFTLTEPTRVFVNNALSIAGFGNAPNGDLLTDISDAAFSTWDMLSSIGPISGTMDYLQWGIPTSVATDGGLLFFDDRTVQGTFQAIVEAPAVPLPAAGWLLVAGLGGFAVLRRRAPRDA